MMSVDSDKDRDAGEVSQKLAELKGKVQEHLDSDAEQKAEEEAPSPKSTKAGDDPPPEPDEESSNMSTQMAFQDMSGSQQVAAWNAMASRAKRKGLEVSPVKKFKNHKIGVERLNKLEAKLATAGSASPASVAKKANGKKAAKATKASTATKAKFGHDRTIVSVEDENPRFKGTKAFKLFEEMRTWVKKHKGKPVSQLIEETNYRRQDFEWDLKRKSIQVQKIAH